VEGKNDCDNKAVKSQSVRDVDVTERRICVEIQLAMAE